MKYKYKPEVKNEISIPTNNMFIVTKEKDYRWSYLMGKGLDQVTNYHKN